MTKSPTLAHGTITCFMGAGTGCPHKRLSIMTARIIKGHISFTERKVATCNERIKREYKSATSEGTTYIDQ